MVCRAKALLLILCASLWAPASAVSLCGLPHRDHIALQLKQEQVQEKSPFDSNQALVTAMNKLASNESPENRREVYEALLGSMLLVRVPEIPSGLGAGLQITKADTQIHLISTLDCNRVRITAAFTDLEALRNWDPNTPYLGIKAQDLFRLVMGTDIQEIAINPFGPAGKTIRPGGRLKRHEIKLLSEGKFPSGTGPGIAQFQMKEGEKVFIGAPAHPPSPTVEELLKNEAKSLAPVAELYVFQMATAQAGSSHTVIGIVLSDELPKDQKDEVVKTLSTSVRTELKRDQSLDFMFLGGPTRDQVRALGTLIFRRQ